MAPVVNVDKLKPFTQYYFRAAVETVYNQRLGILSLPGPAAVFKTKAKGKFLFVFVYEFILDTVFKIHSRDILILENLFVIYCGK